MVSSMPRPNPPPTVVPWFLDPSEQSAEETIRKPSQDPHASSSIARPSHPPLPADLPTTSVLGQLYDLLKTSPHLEPGTLLVREPIPTADGPPLPAAAPKGRRQRGRTYFGEGVKLEGLESGGLWNWIMVAQVCVACSFQILSLNISLQVKAGTEKRGAIESVVRLVRKAVCHENTFHHSFR